MPAFTPRAQGARMGLLVLFVLTAVFAFGLLFVKYKLQSVRETILQQAESRTGVKFGYESIEANGLRGLQIRGFNAEIDQAPYPGVTLSVPEVVLNVNIIDLLYGEFTVESVRIDHAQVSVERDAGQPWFPPKSGEGNGAFTLPGDFPFRLTGTDCSLEILNVVGETSLSFDSMNLDVSRLSASDSVSATVSANLGGDPEKSLKLEVDFSSLEDFDLRLSCDRIAAADVNAFLPTSPLGETDSDKGEALVSGRFIESGIVRPYIRVGGYPGNTMMISTKIDFESLAMGNQPDFIAPASGTLSALATYNTEWKVLALTTAKAESSEISGRIEGTIFFDAEDPVFDLRLSTDRLPITHFINSVLGDRVEKYGTVEYELTEPNEIVVALNGTSRAPEIRANADVGGGKISFSPTDKRHPAAHLELGGIKLAWDSTSGTPSASFNVTGGSISHEESGFEAVNVTGSIKLEDNIITVSPLNAEITGNNYVGELSFNLDTKDADFSISGGLSRLEETVLATAPKDTTLSGAVSAKCEGNKRGDIYTIDATIDCTQMDLEYRWWFKKPAGIVLNAQVHARIEPFKTLKAEFTDVEIASSHIRGVTNLAYVDNKWRLQSISATSDILDIPSIGKCVRLPYKISGGKGTKGYYEWKRQNTSELAWTQSIGCRIDSVELVPEGGEIPMQIKDVDLLIAMQKGPGLESKIDVKAKQATMPPIGSVWFVPLRTDEELLERFPPVGWETDFTLSVEQIEVPPWKGSNFSGTAYATLEKTGLSSYSADMDGGGQISGSFNSNRLENTYETSHAWREIASHYIIDYLKYPRVLSGPMTGQVTYSIDRDDPGTLVGEGDFEVRDGRFSADFLSSLFEEHFEGELSVLPPSLKFSYLQTDVKFEGDMVTTPEITVLSNQVKLNAGGGFVRDGDMDYDVKIAFSPETAKNMPMLREYFNVQGMKLAQQDIELEFKVQGHTINPESEVTKLPEVSDILVSGALEVTSEIINLPRKILLDVFKTMGGIIGSAK